ncbi:MAG: DUF3800 domain-containing protein [Betaproteobacteria bacterium]|nr:DUF3800 domain-containing protein [Betaproteobacteria bacterium]
MSILIYLDESGDLGWSFSLPYTKGGSSRHLTIGALVVPEDKKHLPGRIIRDLYTERGWNTAGEKKWADMSDKARADFVSKALKLKHHHPEISYHAIVVNKRKVLAHMQTDPNLLYNYMIKLLLVNEMAKHPAVTLVPDPRSIKVQSGNSMHDYLQLNLWYTENVSTSLTTLQQDSKKTLSLQFADMLSGAVQAHYEHGRSDPLNGLRDQLHLKELFF